MPCVCAHLQKNCSLCYERRSSAQKSSTPQSELGELIGLSRESICAALKRLDAQGLISTAYGGVVVKNFRRCSTIKSAIRQAEARTLTAPRPTCLERAKHLSE
jgi:DNA-binding FadR family transcriptional regulator